MELTIELENAAPATPSALEALLVGVLRAKDPATLAHVERVVGYARAICRELERRARRSPAGVGGRAWAALPTEAVLRRAALFHDLGKIAVDDAILFKPGVLDDMERAAMREHPEAGRGLLADFGGEALGDPRVLEGVLHHHERWDGRGYPQGLIGEQIPITARIIAVADAYDAMTSVRPYRGAMGTEVAAAEIERCRGTQFDPWVVDAFMRCVTSCPAPDQTTEVV